MVARGKGRPKLTEAVEIDRAIREAALQMLLDHGEAATMNAVAVAAGISRKSLYARYPNKTELFLEAIRELLKPAGPLEYHAGGSVEERLHNYIDAAFRVIARPESLTIQRLLTLNPAYIAALKGDMLDATHKIFFDPLLDLLRGAHASGELVVDEVEETARAVLRLILAQSMPMGGGAAAPAAADGHGHYAAFLTKLIARGILPR